MQTDEPGTDTSPEALAVQLDSLRRMTSLDRLRMAQAWSRDVRQMAFAAIRRRHPALDENEVRLQFIELTYGKALADDVRRWQTAATAEADG